jgi:hypothetical protein
VELQLWIKAVGIAWQLRRFREKKGRAYKGDQNGFGEGRL